MKKITDNEGDGVCLGRGHVMVPSDFEPPAYEWAL
jgi:hypothetical protein